MGHTEEARGLEYESGNATCITALFIYIHFPTMEGEYDT